jgi:hypothetical protein
VHVFIVVVVGMGVSFWRAGINQEGRIVGVGVRIALLVFVVLTRLVVVMVMALVRV